jgi:hypothetical protein
MENSDLMDSDNDEVETSDNENTKDNENTDQSLPKNNAEIDKLTLELLLNKNHYSKYLSKNDPKKYDEFREFKAKLRKYSIDIVDITSQLIENPKKPFSSDIEDSFLTYVKSIFRHLELKKMENSGSHNEDDDDVLFGNFDKPDETNDDDESTPMIKSFWGKTQVVKKQSDFANFDIRMFGKTKR